jgi:hypothetical protein
VDIVRWTRQDFEINRSQMAPVRSTIRERTKTVTGFARVRETVDRLGNAQLAICFFIDYSLHIACRKSDIKFEAAFRRNFVDLGFVKYGINVLLHERDRTIYKTCTGTRCRAVMLSREFAACA